MANDTKPNDDRQGAALIVCLTVLFVLCWGDPDLLDAIIARVMP